MPCRMLDALGASERMLILRECRFGWTNASYSYGLDVIGEELVEHLRAGYRWEQIEGSAQKQKL